MSGAHARAIRAVLLVTSALALPATAFAQDRKAADADSDGDIIVTARRVEERLQDVPISITVFNQQQLAERNVVNANDLATYTPSLSANSRFGNETASFAIRGFVQEAQTAPSVAVYFADVVAARGQPSLAGANNVPSGSFIDLQNVQVLKGPQGTLFGRNTTGGAVLLVPQKPTDNLEGYVEGSIGNYDMKRGQAVINVPLAETFKVRIAADRMKRDGYLRNRSGIGPDDFNDVNYTYVRASIVADLTPDLENYFIFNWASSKTNGNSPRLALTNTRTINGVPCQPGVNANGTTIAGAGALIGPLVCAQQSPRFAGYGYYDTENNNPDAHLDVKQWQVINTTTLRASDTLTVKNIASYVELRQNQSANLFGDNIRFPVGGGVTLPFGYVNVFSDPGRDTVAQYTFTEEFRLEGNAGEQFNYQVGAYYEKSGPLTQWQGTRTSIFASCTDVQALQCTDILRNPVTGAPGGFVQNTLTRYRFQNIGFYGQATYNFTEQLSITGGLRYTIDKASGDGSVRTFIFPAPNTAVPICGSTGLVTTDPSECVVSRTEKSKRPTWLIGLDYKPSEDTLLYGKYARGYRQGGVNPSNTLPITWEPEKVDTFELGAKQTFRGAVSGYFNIAAFYNNFTNQQLQANLVPDPSIPGNRASPSAAIVNAGKSTIQGIEIETMISPVEGLRFTGGYTYLDTKLKSYTPPNFPGFLPPTATSAVGGALSLSPKHKLTVSGAYTLPLDESVGRISFGATYTHTAKMIASADSPLGTLPSTDLVNLNFSWKGIAGTPIDLTAFVTNVTKEKYPVYIGGTYYSAGVETLLLGQPRIYGMSLRFNFGQ